uniref:AAA+ ATPase domain-containing protein n=1 Tax=Zea mays TaxID=4577 RepID=A0A804NJI5_MAIZE|eukprot:XP_020408000.1 uncharacterized protein LOC103652705 isoform X3 [Zea mays]
MAKTSEVIAGIALGIPLMNGVLVPIITILVNRFFSILLTDTSRKLSNLENLTIPSLKETLVQVEEQRMVRAPKDAQSESDLRTLDGLTTELKAALYEAEEILDLVDYYRIKKRIADDAEENGRSRWVQQTLRAFRTSMARCQGSSWVRHLHDCVGLCVACCKGTLFRRSGEQLPISHASSVSMAQRLRGWYRHLVHHIPSSSRSVMQWLRHWFQHLVFNFAKLCESGTQTLPGLPAADVIATNQDWSYKVIGINSNQNDGTATASFLLTIARHNLTKRIEHIENVLNDLKKSHLLNQQSTISSSSNKEKSSRHEDIQYLYRSIERKVIGRDKEREKLISMLRRGPGPDTPSSSSSKHYSVIGIYGIAGSGKSTLAQYVCDYEKAEGQHFDPVMFIHVSQTFRVDKIFRDMLREIRKDRQSDSNSVKCLHDELKEKLRGKCFLLVLDDLWVSRENQEERAILLTVLDAGQSGSRVLVTAQKKDVAAALGAEEQIPIPDMEEEQYFSMFMHYALEAINSTRNIL